MESEFGLGTIFTAYFPAVKEGQAEQKPAEPRAKLPMGTETILVVEDEPSVRLLANHLLQRCGYTVLQAPSSIATVGWNRDSGPVGSSTTSHPRAASTLR